MKKITTVEGIEISFNDAIEQKQKEIYKKDKKKYKQYASKSSYSSIGLMVARNETESKELLNEMLRNELKNGKDLHVANAILTNAIFEAEEETIKQLAASAHWSLRKKAAELCKDKKFLNEMLRKEFRNERDDYVENAICTNTFFEAEEETIKQLAKSVCSIYRQKAAKLCKDKKFLNEMLRYEVKNGYDAWVPNAIFTNAIFEAEEETIKQLAESVCWEYRQKAAELCKDKKFLNEMLRNELKNEKNFHVANSICTNAIFEAEEETIKQLATSTNWSLRKKAAELCKDKKFLNEMLRKELSGERDYYVEKAIFSNTFFEAEEETIKQLAESVCWEYRQKAAELCKDKKFLNEMLRKELKNGKDFHVANAIYTNAIFEAEEETIKQLEESGCREYRQKAEELCKDKKFLNEMLRKELKNEKNVNEKNVYVENAIFTNTIFKAEEETIKQLAASVYLDHRQKAAKLCKDKKFLNEMLRKELKNGKDFHVANAIYTNAIFEAEEETIKQLEESGCREYRQKAAELCKDKKILNEMLRKELKNGKDFYVEMAIFTNTIFEAEEKTINQLAKSTNVRLRQKAAELTKNSNVLLEMFVREIESDYADLRVIETIVKNEAFIPEKTALLECIRKTY